MTAPADVWAVEITPTAILSHDVNGRHPALYLTEQEASEAGEGVAWACSRDGFPRVARFRLVRADEQPTISDCLTVEEPAERFPTYEDLQARRDELRVPVRILNTLHLYSVQRGASMERLLRNDCAEFAVLPNIGKTSVADMRRILAEWRGVKPAEQPAPLPEHLGMQWVKAARNARCLEHGAPLVRIWTHRATFECGCEHWFGKPKDEPEQPQRDDVGELRECVNQLARSAHLRASGLGNEIDTLRECVRELADILRGVNVSRSLRQGDADSCRARQCQGIIDRLAAPGQGGAT